MKNISAAPVFGPKNFFGDFEIAKEVGAYIEFGTVFGDFEIAPFTYGVTLTGNTVGGDLVLNPYADGATIDVQTVYGDVILDDAWSADLDFGLVGGDVDIYDAAFGTASIGTVIGSIKLNDSNNWDISAFTASAVEIDDSYGADLSLFWMTGYTEIDDSDGVDYTVDYSLGGDVEVDDSVDVVVTIGYATDTNIEVDDSVDVVVDLGFAPGAEVEIEDNHNFTATVAGGDVEVTVDDSDGVVVTGWGADEFDFTDSDVAYNPGAGNDDVSVDGGRTIGVLTDGMPDTIIYYLEGGGDHDVFVDGLDVVLVDAGTSGAWDFGVLTMITGGGNTLELGDLTLTVHQEDMPITDEWLMVA